MGANSKIEWTHHTFNPWIGCTKVSDGCKNCYAEALMDKRWGKVQWGPNGTRVKTSPANWREPYKWDRAAKAAGERHRVFCASLADVMEGRPELDEWLVDLLLLVDDTPNLDWLFLTKRPENYRKLLPTSFQKYPRRNLWLGTSVEDQATADRRIPELLACTWAAVRFLSIEPLLGGLYFWKDEYRDRSGVSLYQEGIDWVIVGGESGAHARPMHPDWARSLRDQCQAVGVPFHFKQWGEYGLEQIGHVRFTPVHSGVPMSEPAAMFRVGKHAAGRLLDGREWNELPVDKSGKCLGEPNAAV